MYEKLRNELSEFLPSKSKVLVAVSGGPDSMALCHILWRYAQDHSQKEISLVITHVHHGVRKESDFELLLVQRMALTWGIPCLIHRFDAKGHAKTIGKSFQESARDWRYARWKEDMLREACTLLATAHHLGDQSETILYRLLRGSGTAGLAGIYPNKDAIIRPLLSYRKSDLLNYCEQESVPYALDHSNEDPVYVRNRIRLELIPELECHYNPRLQEALGRTAELLRWDEEYFAQQLKIAWKKYCIRASEGIIGLSRGVLTEPQAILSRLVRKAAAMVADEPRGLGYAYVSKIMDSQGKVGWTQDLPGMTIKITANGIWFQRPSAVSEQEWIEFPETPLVVGQWTEIPNQKLSIGLLTESVFLASKDDSEALKDSIAIFDYEGLSWQAVPLVCRTRRQGDAMWFKGVGHKPLKKVFQEGKISDQERKRTPIIARETDVLWIPGVRQSDLFRPSKKGERLYCILRHRKGL